jgi:monofunctional biosynthetic peptidoglycan transglycosylase
MRRWLIGGLVAWAAVTVLLVLVFRLVDPPASSVMLQRWLTEGAAQTHRWVPIDAMDPQLALAVIAAEDQRFPVHWGFDAAQIRAAVEGHLEGRPLRGASTISQQVARNLFLWQGGGLLRKGLEAWFTILIELLWSKQRILEVYLNIAETGERMFGMAEAAERYFGRPVAGLGARRAALLAAVLPNPVVYRVDRPSAYVLQRRNWIVMQMRNLGGVAYLGQIAPVTAVSR